MEINLKKLMYNLSAPSTEMKILKIINKNIVFITYYVICKNNILFYFCVKLLHLISISFNIIELKIHWSVVIWLSVFFQSASVLRPLFPGVQDQYLYSMSCNFMSDYITEILLYYFNDWDFLTNVCNSYLIKKINFEP